MDPLMHSNSSVKKWGGNVDDYLPIHHWFDDSKRGFANITHRAMRHHSEGIGWCIDTFGKYLELCKYSVIDHAIDKKHGHKVDGTGVCEIKAS